MRHGRFDKIRAMRILQITDLHLYGKAGGSLRGVETDSSLRNVLDAAMVFGPAEADAFSAILVTGDVVQDDPGGYLRFKSILGPLRIPVLCVPGNHDDPAAMQTSLAQEPFRYCGSHRVGGWQFIMLDSFREGHDGGRLTSAELERLDAALQTSPAHAMVCLHHHPMDMGSRWLDTIGLANAVDFWAVIDRHPQVRAVVWGHVHQTYEGERNGVRLYATPSTGAQFVTHSDRYAVDSAPPAYRTFDLAADGRIQSTVRWLAPMQSDLAAAI